MSVAFVLSAVSINVSPNASGLPGSSSLLSLLDGLQFWGVLACVAWMILAAIFWAFSSHLNNYQGVSRGRTAFLGSAAAAAVVGAAPFLVQWLADFGQGAH